MQDRIVAYPRVLPHHDVGVERSPVADDHIVLHHHIRPHTDVHT